MTFIPFMSFMSPFSRRIPADVSRWPLVEIFGVGRESPRVSERIDHLSEAIAPEHVGEGRSHGAAGFHGAIERRIHIGHIEEHDTGREPRGLRRLVDTGLAGHGLHLVCQHEDRVSNFDLGVRNLAVRTRHPHALSGAERLLVELNRLRGIVKDQVRGNRVISVRNGLDLLGGFAGEVFLAILAVAFAFFSGLPFFAIVTSNDSTISPTLESNRGASGGAPCSNASASCFCCR